MRGGVGFASSSALAGQSQALGLQTQRRYRAGRYCGPAAASARVLELRQVWLQQRQMSTVTTNQTAEMCLERITRIGRNLGSLDLLLGR